MPIRPIVRLGHPALRTPAQPVEPETLQTPEIQALIDDMIETMDDAGGVGLAAPQVGLEIQLFVYLAIDDRDGPDDEEPETRVLVNPAIEPEPGDLLDDWEGCLSIPDLRGLVPRHPAIRVHGRDRDGEAVEDRAEGFEARIIQHEYDHLNGVIFLDRMRDLRSLAYGEEWEEYMTTDDEEDPSVG